MPELECNSCSSQRPKRHSLSWEDVYNKLGVRVVHRRAQGWSSIVWDVLQCTDRIRINACLCAQLTEFFAQYAPVNCVRMRRHISSKNFKGSVFVEFASVADAEKVGNCIPSVVIVDWGHVISQVSCAGAQSWLPVQARSQVPHISGGGGQETCLVQGPQRLFPSFPSLFVHVVAACPVCTARAPHAPVPCSFLD